MKPQEDPKRGAAGYKVMQRITVAVRSQVDLGRVLDQLAADAGRFLDLTLCGIARWDDAGRALHFTIEYRRDTGEAPRLTLQGRRFEPGSDPKARELETIVFKEHRSLTSAAPAARAIESATVLADLAGQAFVVTPMVADQRLVGLLVAVRPRELQAWADDELEFLRLAGDLAAVALQHAALRSQLRILLAASAEINSKLDLQALLRRLTEAAMSATRSTMGVAGLIEGEAMVSRELCREGVWSALEWSFRRDEGLPGWSWSNRAPSISNDARSDPRAVPQRFEAIGARSALTLPIVDRDGEVLGFFELYDKAGGVPFGAEDIHLATALAHCAALALEARQA